MHLQQINDLMGSLDRISLDKSSGRSLPHNPLGSNGGLGVVLATPKWLIFFLSFFLIFFKRNLIRWPRHH
jgi:hypothetical protein